MLISTIMTKQIYWILWAIALVGVLTWWGKEAYTMYQHRGNYDMYSVYNTTPLSLEDIDGQTLSFDDWASYRIEGERSDFERMRLELHARFENEDENVIPMQLLSCTDDILGREYCEYVSLSALRGEANGSGNVSDACQIIDPYHVWAYNPECETQTSDDRVFISGWMTDTPPLWSKDNSRRILLVNPSLDNATSAQLRIETVAR